MSYECFEVTIESNVAHVQLSRPDKRNSMIPAFWTELPAIVADIDNNARARVIVLSSQGPHFSSGLDVSAFQRDPPAMSEQDKTAMRIRRGAAFYENVLHMQRSFSCLEAARIPVIAAVQGGAIGGGVDLCTACDMRYASADAFFTIHEINIGMTADVGTFPRLVKLIPEGIVRELAYTGRRMSATEAQAAGLVNRVFADHATLLDGVMQIASEIASKAPLAIYGSKRMINYARDHSTADGLDYIGIWNASMLQTEEIREAFDANANRRPGAFVDLPVKK